MKQIPMLDLRLEYEYMKNEIDTAIANCLKHQQWILGPEVKELETKISQYLEVKHCIGVSSGTEALVLSLRALAIKLRGQEYFNPKDEIITTPFTFTATGDAILRARAKPVFIDVDKETYNLDTTKVRKYIEKHNKVIGIIPVHLYGQPCNMDEIMAIAQKFNLFVIEDVAQAFGSMWHNKKLGSIGTTGAFSFFPSKNLGSYGDAGMVATNDDELAELIRMLTKHGGKDKYNVDHIGYNARLDTLQAAILLAKFQYIDEFNQRRRKIAQFYNAELKRIKEIRLPQELTEAYHVYHQYTVRILNGKRDELQQFLKDKGIATMVYYPVPLHQMKVFDGKMKAVGKLKNAEKLCNEVLSLPVEPLLTEQDLKIVVDTIKEFFQ
ncbi:MAG: DegT/DnrJ/EryC1/StrS family aminotransferase [candidate division WOR-3 bacterium]|nr:DegT/DnrJ/EryC1/StrS family aminotransferase [candidate division WOR-3 bacterium]